MSTKKIIVIFLLLIFSSNPSFAIKDIRKENTNINYKYENVNIDWWKSYNDAYLTGYIEKAIKDNNDLQVSTLKVEQARQNIKLRFAKELPNAQIGFSPALYKTPFTNSTSSSLSVPIVVNYEADVFLKNRDKTKSMKKLYEAQKIQERAAYIAISSQIGATYFNIVGLDRLIDLQKQLIEDRKIIYELMKIRNDYGLTSTADLTKAEKSYVLSVADLSDLEKAREILLRSLAVLIGESPENINNIKRVSYDKMVELQAIPKEILSEVIVKRPDYLIAEKMIEKSGLDVKIAKKEFLPTINIFGVYSFNSIRGAGGMGWENALMALAGSAMLDVFKGGAKIANLRLKKNLYEQTVQNYYKTNLIAIKEVNDALCALKFDNNKYEKNLKSYNMQEKDYYYTKIKYSDGLISQLDLIQQRENLLTTNKLVISSKIDCYINQISLYKAVGGNL